MSREILDCLKRKQDICIKNIIPSQNTAFMYTPALTAVKRKRMRNALVPGRRPRKFPRQNLTETIAEPVLRD